MDGPPTYTLCGCVTAPYRRHTQRVRTVRSRQAGRQAGTARILNSQFFSSPTQPSPLNLSTSAVGNNPRTTGCARPSVRRPLANVGSWRVRGGREVRETRRVISEVTGHGSRPAAVMALWEPGQCWTTGRLDDDGTGAWRTEWFVCYVAGACVSVSVCCRLSGFSGSISVCSLCFVLCLRCSMARDVLVSLMRSDKLRGRGRGRWRECECECPLVLGWALAAVPPAHHDEGRVGSRGRVRRRRRQR